MTWREVVLERDDAGRPLNRDRWQEESAGKLRWLRPDFQTGRVAAPAQAKLDVDAHQGADLGVIGKVPWPKVPAAQVDTVRAALTRLAGPPSVEAVASQFKGAKRDRVAMILQVMALVG